MPDNGPAERQAAGTGPGAVDIIARRIGEKGRISFAEFMETALYAPSAGYYTSGRQTWGRGGDYITSLDVSPAFARALARQAIEFWGLLGSPGAFTIVEAGAGRGWLCLAMLDYIRDACPQMYRGLRACLVDPGARHHDATHEKASWHASIDALGPFKDACVISNELIDAFPVHRVEFTRGEMTELYVGFDGAAFFEEPGPPSEAALAAYFRKAGVEPFEGLKTEVCLAAGLWIRKAAALFDRGFVLTVDYGMPARELYSPDRRAGSLHCHFRHTLNDNPFANVGEQDITAQVDFTSLAVEGMEAGLGVAGFTTQKNFLLGLGILEELREPVSLGVEGVEAVNFNRALGALISPGGMGDTFKVMVQHKGVEKPALKGFSFKDMTRSLCLP